MSALLLGFEQSYQSLLRFLTRRTGCAETARELAHETWLRVAEAAPELPGGGVPEQQRAYLYTVAQNLALDHLRRQARGGERFVDAAAAPQDMVPDGADLERSLALRQAVQAVEGGLGGLPPRAREAFLAHRLDGLGHEELAARHGVSVKTIERDMGQAMDAVHQALLRWRGEPRAPRRRRQALSGLLGGGALLLSGGLAWRLWRADASADGALIAAAGPALAERRLRSRPAQLLEQRLPDGSELRLDADSELHWRWHAGLRQARLLRGAAYFSVRPDAERPFVVQAGDHSVRVLGTAFALELDGPRLLVAVEHGRVRVSDAAGGRRELVSGEQLVLLAGQAPADAGPAAPARGVAPWRAGWLEFDERPLDEVLQRLARYLPQRLSWSAAAGRRRVSARVHLAHLQEWLRLLPDSHGLALQPQADGGWRLQLRDE